MNQLIKKLFVKYINQSFLKPNSFNLVKFFYFISNLFINKLIYRALIYIFLDSK